MKVIVKPHSIQVISTPVNELEVNVTTVEFEFSEEITNDFVKEAYFTLDDNTYKKVIVNNECEIPSEVLTKVGTVELGVVAYYADPVNDELIRYNPKPGYFTSWEGSLKDAENSQPITPSEMEQFETALNDGLETLDYALDDLQDKVDSGYFDGQDGRDGTDGITPTIGDNGNWYLGSTDTGKPSRGEKGLTGDTGATGSPGVDGYSPTASVSKSGNTATITITDKNGTTTTTISDGTNGTNGRDGYVQYTAGDNITIENNVISASGGSSVPIYYLSTTLTTTSDWENSTYLSDDDRVNLSAFIKDAYDKNYNTIMLLLTSPNGRKAPILFNTGNRYASIPNKPANIYLCTIIGQNGNRVSSNETKMSGIQLSLSVTWNDNVPTVTEARIVREDFRVLSTTNTALYTPTSNYHPATKKYVDDAITSAITTTLGGSY